jgi:hypothetical protein
MAECYWSEESSLSFVSHAFLEIHIMGTEREEFMSGPPVQYLNKRHNLSSTSGCAVFFEITASVGNTACACTVP